MSTLWRHCCALIVESCRPRTHSQFQMVRYAETAGEADSFVVSASTHDLR